MQISKVIKKYGYTIDQLNDEMQLGTGTLRSRICSRNGVEPNLQVNTLRAIADALGCPISEFFEDEPITKKGKVIAIEDKVDANYTFDLSHALQLSGKTKKDLAEHMEMTTQNLNYLEREKAIKVEHLVAFANYLQLPIECFFTTKPTD